MICVDFNLLIHVHVHILKLGLISLKINQVICYLFVDSCLINDTTACNSDPLCKIVEEQDICHATGGKTLILT